MDTPLTPLEFARRARSIYADRLAVVDGDVRLTYAQFFAHCDRWSAVLSEWGVEFGDRIAYIAPNTHAQLAAFYAVPQLGAVLVPINDGLTGDDFASMIEHSGAKVVCVHADSLATVAAIRSRCPAVVKWVALEGRHPGFEDYEALIAGVPEGHAGARAAIQEGDLLTINYASGTTSPPKGVMITHRNAWINCVGTLLHHPMTPADNYLWTVPMFEANGWTFTWTVTAAGGTHVCLRKIIPEEIFALCEREQVTQLACVPTVLLSIATMPAGARRNVPRNIHVLTAGTLPAAATIERIENELGWTVTHVYGLTETVPFITMCAALPAHATLGPGDRTSINARQGVELVTSGELRVVDEQMQDVPRDATTIGEVVVRGNAVMLGYYNDPEATMKAFEGGYFHTGDAAVVHSDGYLERR